jgi:hypothetical protein
MQANVYPSDASMKDDEIRLIRLLPGSWADEIRCELVYDSLANVRSYYALSYVWGSRHVTRSIQLNAQPFRVTVNLEAALRHLREQLHNELLWIDALSINQKDDQERTHQVSLMGSIYRSSKSVLVYLGDDTVRFGRIAPSQIVQSAPPIFKFSHDDSKFSRSESSTQTTRLQLETQPELKRRDQALLVSINLFAFIQDLSRMKHLTEVSCFTLELTEESDQRPLKKLFESLRQLMHAPFTPWWGRIWVVQEVILPPEAVVIYGTISAPWAMLSQAASKCTYHLHHCCSKHMESFPRDMIHVLKDFCERVLDIETMRMLYTTDTFNKHSKNIGCGVAIFQSAEQRSLISLLRRFRNRKATDPRDKIYALLSLVKPDPDRKPLFPDYSLSDQQVYINASIESIYSSGSLSILSIDVARKYRHDLPTWVPDWEAPGEFGHNERMDAISQYNACSDFPINSSIVRIEGSALVLQGRIMGCVISVGSVMLSDSPETFQETIKSWLSIFRSSRSVESRDIDRKHSLWRVLCADVLHEPQSEKGNLLRRTELPDELMFVTWALLSKRSPFNNSKIRLSYYISPGASLWSDVLSFEICVSGDDAVKTGLRFRTLYRNASKRRQILAQAWKLDDSQTVDKDAREHHKKLLDDAAMDNIEELLLMAMMRKKLCEPQTKLRVKYSNPHLKEGEKQFPEDKNKHGERRHGRKYIKSSNLSFWHKSIRTTSALLR